MTLFDMDIQLLEWINNHRLKALDPLFLAITDTAYLLAFLVAFVVLAVGLYNKNLTEIRKGLYLLIALGVNTVIVTLIKYLVNRERPFVHNDMVEKLTTGNSPSFPSGHTSDAFIIAVLFCILFPRKLWMQLLIWGWALAVAYSRIVLGVHYPSDVLGSIFIGTGVATLVYSYFKLHRRKQNEIRPK